MFKVNNRNTETRCEICSKLPIKTPERCQWRCSSVFIINFEHSVFPCPCSSVVNFEPVNGSRVSHTNFHLNLRLVISSEAVVDRCLAKNCVENSLKHVTLLTRRLCHTCHMFPVHVANIFRAALSHNNSRRLILKIHFISLNFLKISSHDLWVRKRWVKLDEKKADIYIYIYIYIAVSGICVLVMCFFFRCSNRRVAKWSSVCQKFWKLL